MTYHPGSSDIKSWNEAKRRQALDFSDRRLFM